MHRAFRHTVLCTAALTSVVLAQDRISVESQIDKHSITIGDRVLYTVKVTADTSLLVDSLVVGTNLGMFEIKDYVPRKIEVHDGMKTSTESFAITTFTTGDYEIPPVTIKYQTRVGEEKSITTDPIAIKVNSLLKGEEGEDIKPLRGPKEFRHGVPWWLILSAAGLILAIALYIYFYRRAKKPIDLGGEPTDTRLPWEIALDDLARLRESPYIAKGEYKLYYLRLSDIFRHYLERRYGISALERTTDEIISEFRALALDKEEEQAIQRLLDSCDLVKFAKYDPTPGDIESHFNLAYDFVLKTRSLPYISMRDREVVS